MRAVLDANVLVAGIIGEDTPPRLILDALRLGHFRLVVSSHVLGEVKIALSKPYFRRRLDADDAALALADLRRDAEHIDDIDDVVGIATHAADDPVIATAVSARADYLVTGDRELRAIGSHGGVSFITPAEFLTILDAGVEGGFD